MNLFELRRFLRAPITVAALVVLALIPLLYGALYLWAFWDPYGNMRHIPVAIVNADRPARAADGSTLNAGKDLADELQHRDVFGWQPATAEQARKGLEDGRYQLVFQIPADFSASLVTPPDPAKSPERGRLLVVNDDATNYLSGQLSRSVFTEVRAGASGTAARRYFDRMLIGFTDLKTQTQQAADGAAQLAGGAADARNGAGDLASGADRAQSGAAQLDQGLARSTAGSQQLYDGLVALDAGAAQLADGTAQAAAGGRLLAGKVDAAADKAEPALRDNAELIATAATAIADGADLIAQHLDALPALARTAAQQTAKTRSDLEALGQRYPQITDSTEYRTALSAADAAAKAAQQLQTRLDTGDLNALRAQMAEVAATARKVAAAAPHLADDVAAARAQVDALADGLEALAGGAERLHTGTGTAVTGARDLNGGLFRLSTGARQLDDGLGTLSDGSHRLASGLAGLGDGATRLADGLSDGAAKIPGYDPDTRADRAGVLGDPVSLQRDTEHPAATYGAGFAPYFLALALWVGAMISYMVLRPLTRRHLVSGARPYRAALAGWLPALLIGVVQAGALFLVVRFALGLHPAHPLGMFAFLCLTAVAFTALVQWFGARLGPAGRLVALAVLMLQLTSSGGTYPIETTPAFLQAVHPFLPMTYVVSGLRHLVNGGPGGTVLTGAIVLFGFAAAAFALTTLAAWRGRKLTPSKLHPDLVM
ncbi:YhgE/Pip domain-containing protein [Dactylosporangium darangshiense]|uniref:YhgE/Pip domain-containing protein n=1 Tax=Dactylosporangium darangshiense TaxID=579108 RepID=A0ABP8DQQ8_9ACTN